MYLVPWIRDDIIFGLKTHILPGLIELIKDNNNLQVTFLASHSKIVDRPRMIFVNSLLDEYNKQLKALIQELLVELKEFGVGESRLSFMDVLPRIAETLGDKIPLVTDTTHLNWPIGKNNNKPTVQVPTQLTINNILLNFYCRDKFKKNESEYCCF